MPEYAALLHHHNAASEDGGGPPPTADEMNEAFLRMESAGLCKVLN